MAALKQLTVFKLALLQKVTKDDKSLADDLVAYLGGKYDRNEKNDFDNFVGGRVYKGQTLETFLKKEGKWDEYFESIRNEMTSDKVVSCVERGNPQFRKVRKQNPGQANVMLLQEVINQNMSPMVRYAFKLKKDGKSDFSKAIINSLGAKSLSQGTWVGVFRGMRDRGLSTTVGYGFQKAVDSGVVHETSIALQDSVAKYAKEHGLRYATKFKSAVKNTLASAAVVAAMALTMAEAPDVHNLELAKGYVDKVEMSNSQSADKYPHENIDTFEWDDSVFEPIEVPENFTSLESIPVSALDDDNVPTLSSFGQQIDSLLSGVSQDYSVKEGDNVWKISADIVTQSLKGREYILDNQGRFDNIVAQVSEEIVRANNLENPDHIEPTQILTLPSEIVSAIKSKLGLTSESVEKIESIGLSKDLPRAPSMHMMNKV